MIPITANSGVTVVPFHWGHVAMMDLRWFERNYFRCLPDYKQRLQQYSQYPHCYSALYRGKVACCWGVVPVWGGVAEAWLLTSDIVSIAPVSLTRGAMRYFDTIVDQMRLFRLQIVVDSRNTLAIRWAEVLHFVREGTLKSFGPDGADYYMYARITDGWHPKQAKGSDPGTDCA
jgi:hypothetical protein